MGMSIEKTRSDWQPFDEVEPYRGKADLGETLDEIAALILRYVILDKEQAEAAALWVAHTYLIEHATVSPIVIIDAPERACAKTLFQTVLGRMVFRPLAAQGLAQRLDALTNARAHVMLCHISVFVGK